MSTYPLAELIRKWRFRELTAEQAIGHLLQHLEAQAQRIAEVKQRLRQVEQSAVKPPA